MNKKVVLPLSAIILIIFILSACINAPGSQGNLPTTTMQPTETPLPTATPYDPMPSGSAGYPWWNDVVFYEIFVRSFFDSDGDGIGDIQGLISRLDYLNDGDPLTDDDLGINGIWLMPIFESPSYHGYDVTDYYTINPDYGTMDDFREFLDEAHQRGIRVVIDFVINHTSSQHPWFLEARMGQDSPYRDYYIWAEEKPDYSGPWGEPAWHANTDGTYYYGVFWSGMPDLNFRSPEVTDQIYEIAAFWLDDVGVDGFRVDGARHLIEDGEVQENTPETHAWFKDFYTFYKDTAPDSMTVGEVWDSNFSAVKYVKENEFDLVFDFEMAESILEGLNRNDAGKIRNAFDFNTRLYPDLQKANFLSNHDMNRVIHVLQNDVENAKLAAFLLLTSPGVPFIYYGEEVGMTGAKPDEDIRKPMQWSPEIYGGFSEGIPWRNLNSNYEEFNVEKMSGDPYSLFNTYRSLIHLRNNTAALRVGSYQSLDNDQGQIFSFLRRVDDQYVLAIVNLGEEDVPVEIEMPEDLISFNMLTLEKLAGENEEYPYGVEVIDSQILIKLDRIPANDFGLFRLIPVESTDQ